MDFCLLQNCILFCFFINLSLSDAIKTKNKKIKKEKAMKAEEKELVDFEECSGYDTQASFYQMNLSRPLLKVYFKLLNKLTLNFNYLLF